MDSARADACGNANIWSVKSDCGEPDVTTSVRVGSEWSGSGVWTCV